MISSDILNNTDYIIGNIKYSYNSCKELLKDININGNIRVLVYSSISEKIRVIDITGDIVLGNNNEDMIILGKDRIIYEN